MELRGICPFCTVLTECVRTEGQNALRYMRVAVFVEARYTDAGQSSIRKGKVGTITSHQEIHDYDQLYTHSCSVR